MQRQAITEIVKKFMVEVVEELDPGEIDLAKSMKDMGASSLDIVEIVSGVMRELRVKIPRAELQDVANVEQFVDLLCRAVREKAE
jgi:acyl carrier protein